MRGGLYILLSLMAACLLAIEAQAQGSWPPEPRLALVIGNTRYAAAPLRTPEADARMIAARLESDALAFEVDLALDLNDRQMRAALARFETKLRNTPDAVGLVYFAGHGVQIDGFNYLIPVNLRLGRETTVEDVRAQGVRLGEVTRVFTNARARIGFIIIDACRDNDLPAPYRGGTGLAAEGGTHGLLIAYAAGPGKQASDGAAGAPHSPYAAALDAALTQPGAAPETVFRDVANRVYEATGRRQLPHVETALVTRPGRDEFTFASPSMLSTEYLIREAQTLLEAMGYDPGLIDGRAGTRTGNAVASFRRATALAPGSEVDVDLVEALRRFQRLGHRAPTLVAVEDVESRDGAAAETAPPAAPVEPGDGTYRAERFEVPLTRRVARARGRITESFYADAKRAGADDLVVAETASLLALSVDFLREIHPDDPFEIVFEQYLDPSGEVVRTGEIYYVGFAPRGRPLSYWRYTPQGEDKEADFYDRYGRSARPEGQTLTEEEKPAFLIERALIDALRERATPANSRP